MNDCKISIELSTTSGGRNYRLFLENEGGIDGVFEDGYLKIKLDKDMIERLELWDNYITSLDEQWLRKIGEENNG